MRLQIILSIIVFTCAIGVTASADHPECETYAATQPDAMVTNVLVVYTWDPTCGADPDLGPLERDGDVIEVEWSHNTTADPHEHTVWDQGIDPGVHSYDLTVAPEGEDSYVLHDALAVTGTAPTSDAGPDSGSDADTDVDADSDADADEGGSSGGDSGGCVASGPVSPRVSLLALLIQLAV
jgi:hypothetical protein